MSRRRWLQAARAGGRARAQVQVQAREIGPLMMEPMTMMMVVVVMEAGAGAGGLPGSACSGCERAPAARHTPRTHAGTRAQCTRASHRLHANTHPPACPSWIACMHRAAVSPRAGGRHHHACMCRWVHLHADTPYPTQSTQPMGVPDAPAAAPSRSAAAATAVRRSATSGPPRMCCGTAILLGLGAGARLSRCRGSGVGHIRGADGLGERCIGLRHNPACVQAAVVFGWEGGREGAQALAGPSMQGAVPPCTSGCPC